MVKNAAAKKAARARQHATGEPYMEARRRTAATGDTSPTAWRIQQASDNPLDATPYPFILHQDSTTHGFVDHGIFIGVKDTPGTVGTVTYRSDIAAAELPAALTGKYLVTRDRFTGVWSTWSTPVSSVTTAPPAEQRTALNGGTLAEPGAGAARRAKARALADTRRQRVDNDISIELWLTDDDGEEHLWLVYSDGVTPGGLVAAFTQATGNPEDLTGVILWDEALRAARAGGDLTNLVGWRPVLHPDDKTMTNGPWIDRVNVLTD